MKVSVKICVLILSTLSFILVGCDNKSNPIVEPTPPVDPVPPIKPTPPPVDPVPPIKPTPPPVDPVPPIKPTPPPVECDTSIPESGIHFDIKSVDYSAVNVVELDESNATLIGARQLAAQCAQCHGTFGVAVGDTVENWPSLWGTGRSIAKTMKDYNDTEYEYSAMHIHSSMTYTQDQIKLIQTYYKNVTYTGGE